jgi:hypothetical protein
MAEPLIKRVAPAVALFFVAPLVAEFLLGDLPIKLLGALVVMAPMYGGGALLIREVVRRTGRGWPSIFVLAFAYALFEEAFTTQTLFNPNYLHLNLHLLDHAYIATLGISVWWTIFVLTLHTVWSISVSIGLVEALVPDRATTLWVGRPGVAVTAVLFILGAAASTALEVRQDHYVASTAQFVWAGIVCAAAVVGAFKLPKRSAGPATGWVPSPWLVGAGALAAGSVFMVVPNAWNWWAVAIYLALDLAVIAAVLVLSPRKGWGGMHRLALAGGAALAYAWHAFIQQPAVGGGGISDRIGNAIFAASLIILLVIAAKRNSNLALPSTAPAR